MIAGASQPGRHRIRHVYTGNGVLLLQAASDPTASRPPVALPKLGTGREGSRPIRCAGSECGGAWGRAGGGQAGRAERADRLDERHARRAQPASATSVDDHSNRPKQEPTVAGRIAVTVVWGMALNSVLYRSRLLP
jgi:hypothetical protein